MPGKDLVLFVGGVDEDEANVLLTSIMIDLVEHNVKRCGAKGIEEEQRRRFRVVELLRDTLVDDDGSRASTQSLRIGPSQFAQILRVIDAYYFLARVPRRTTQHPSLAASDIYEGVRGPQR